MRWRALGVACLLPFLQPRLSLLMLSRESHSARHGLLSLHRHMGPYLRPHSRIPASSLSCLFLLCVLCRCRLTKSSFIEPYYMGCGIPKGIRSCAPQIFALHQFSKHHRVGSHLFKNVKELIAFSNSQQTRWRSTSLSISSFLRRTVRSN